MENNIIGERIAGLLREQGKTQRELAEQVGTTKVSMTRYIKGDRVPKGPVLANIAKALHTTTDYLLGNEQDSNDLELRAIVEGGGVMNFVVLMGRMTLIDRDKLLDWLEDERDVCLQHGNYGEASEASYIQKHVMEMPVVKENAK